MFSVCSIRSSNSSTARSDDRGPSPYEPHTHKTAATHTLYSGARKMHVTGKRMYTRALALDRRLSCVSEALTKRAQQGYADPVNVHCF